MFYNDTRRQINVLAEKMMKGNRCRNIFVIIAIAMTMFLISSIIGIGSGYLKSAGRQQQMLNGTTADIILTNPSKQQLLALQQDNNVKSIGISRQIGFIDTTAYPRINSILLRWCDTAEWEQHIAPAVGTINGQYPASGNEIMLPSWVLERMGILEPVLGQAITVSFRYGYTDIHWQPLSEAEDFTFSLCGWYEDYSSNKLYDNAVAYIAADFWQTSVANETNTKSALSLTVSAEGIDQLCAGLEPLNALQELTDLSKAGSSKHSAGPLAAALGMIVTIMVCGSLLIYNVFYISVTKDIQLYGQLKTLGMTKRQMRKMIDRQVRVLSFWGILSGLAFSAATVFVIVPFGIRTLAGELIMDHAISPSYSPLVYAGAAVFSFITALVSSRKPARIASMVSPIEAQRYTAVDAPRKKSSRTARGNKVFRMAVRNVFRDKKGTVLVLASLFLGISLFVVVNGILAGLDVSYLADEYMEEDVVITAGAQTALSRRVLADLKAAWGVQEVSYTTKLDGQWILDTDHIFEQYCADFCSAGTVPQSAAEQYVQGNTYQTYLYGIGEQDFYKAVELMGNSDDFSYDDFSYDQFCNGNLVFCASATIVPYEGTAINGTIELLLNGENYTVTVAPYYLSAKFREDGKTLIAPNIYASREWLERIGAAAEINRIALQTDSSERALAAVNAVLADYSGVTVTSKLEKTKELKASFRGITFLGNAISVILLGIGLMNFINMMYVSVHSRSRELAVLESIGMTRRQLRYMLLIEGSTYAFLTAVLVLTLGSAVLYGSFQLIKVQAAYAVFTYPFYSVGLSLAMIFLLCSLLPLLIYSS